MPDKAEVLERKLQQQQGQVQYRDAWIGPAPGTQSTRGMVDQDARTVELAFSTEEPVMRWGDFEILDHGQGAVRMERLQSGAPLLLGHGGARDQIGVVESARIDSDRVGRAIVRFGRSPLAEEIMQDVDDGIRRLVSVGYIVHRWVVTQNDSEPWEFRATDWEPVEVSIVPVPADAHAGVGRSAEHITTKEIEEMPKRSDAPAGARDDEIITQAEATTTDPDTRSDDEVLRAAEREREVASMRDLGRRFRHLQGAEDMVRDLIDTGGTEDDVKKGLRNLLTTRRPEPVPAARDVRVTGGMPRHSGKLVAFQPDEAGLERAYLCGMWARGFLYGDQLAQRWCSERMDTRAMAGGIANKGGVLVPDEMADAIIDLREQYGVARRLCDVWPMSSDTLFVPRWTGDVTAYFVGENEEITASDPDFDGVQLVARKLAALTKIPEELFEDAAMVIDLADRVANNMAWAFAKKEDECFIDGDGTSTYGGIYGLRPKIIDGTHTVGAVDAAANHDTFGEIDGDDLDTVRATLPEYADMAGDGPVWLASKTARNLTFDAITRAAGGNTMETLAGRPRPAYLGDEIVSSQAMPKGKTTDYSNVAMMFYGNFRMGASLGSRRVFNVRVLTERYAEYDQIGIRATERFDVVIHGLGDTSNAGPIVGLIGE